MVSSASQPALEVNEVPLEALHPDPANPRRIDEEDLDARERSLRHWDGAQPVLALRGAIAAVSSAGQPDPDILKVALDASAEDLDPEVTT
jgi:hypothetical protein